MIAGGRGRQGAGHFPYHPPNLRKQTLGGFSYMILPTWLSGGGQGYGTDQSIHAIPFVLPTPARITDVDFYNTGLASPANNMIAGIYSNYDRQGDYWLSPYPWRKIWASGQLAFAGAGWYGWSGLDIFLPANKILWICGAAQNSNNGNPFMVAPNANYLCGTGIPSIYSEGGGALLLGPGVAFPLELPDEMYQCAPNQVNQGVGRYMAFWMTPK